MYYKNECVLQKALKPQRTPFETKAHFKKKKKKGLAAGKEEEKQLVIDMTAAKNHLQIKMKV